MERFELRGDVVYRKEMVGTPLPDFHQQYKYVPILDRETFREIYKTWILDEQPNLAKVDANIVLAKIIKAWHDHEYPEYFQEIVGDILHEAGLLEVKIDIDEKDEVEE